MGITHITTCNQTSGGGGGGVASVSPGVNVTVTGTATNPIVNACTQSLLFQGVITDTLTSDVNDWAPAGLANASKIIIEGAGNFTITGLAGGSNGRFMILQNNSSGPITLSSANVLSNPSNWFLTESNQPTIIPNNGLCILSYQGGIVAKWYPLRKENNVLRITWATAQTWQNIPGGAYEGQFYEIIDPPAPFTSFFTYGLKDPQFNTTHLATTGFGWVNTGFNQFQATGQFSDDYSQLQECYIPSIKVRSRLTTPLGINCISELATLDVNGITLSNVSFINCNLTFLSPTSISDSKFENAFVTFNAAPVSHCNINNCALTTPQVDMTYCNIDMNGSTFDAGLVNFLRNVYVDWPVSQIILPGFDVFDKTISLDGSTYEYEYDITGITNIDISGFGYDWVGIWNLVSSNATETIDKVSTTFSDSYIEYKFRPTTPGLIVTFVTQTAGSASSSEILIEGGINLDLTCQNCNGGIISDYLILGVTNQVNRQTDASVLP